MRRMVSSSLFAVMFIGLSSEAQETPDSEVPARSTPVPPEELWEELLDQLRPREAIVGLKRPGARRGIWRGTRLASRNELASARHRVAAVPGVEILQTEGVSTYLIARFANEATLGAVRALNVVDYIHPRYFRLHLSSDSGCDNV